ncbi:serine/threonine-protein kinase pim-3-like isoform X2 [Clupea harengus]|uniref:non-specific serine/threonine protein kinase n=1 Tax=Clupea harengus TaxID=7950 RepID=A0A8M1KTL8_CLUHA|nr:serine/threonine-protein kinase pim-3-like isoform X2 [Clupea harengus]
MTMVSELPECSNILKLLEWFEGPDVFVLILERPIPCMDLFDYCLKVQGRLSEQQARDILRQVVLAVKHCRDRGVLHRDIKPENLLVNTENMSVKLIDFGCGDLLSESPFDAFAGTEEFSPPEWVLHGKYEGRQATVWSLGVLLHLLVSGELPFVDEEEIVSGPLRFRRELSWEHLDKKCPQELAWGSIRSTSTKQGQLTSKQYPSEIEEIQQSWLIETLRSFTGSPNLAGFIIQHEKGTLYMEQAAPTISYLAFSREQSL